MPLTPVQRDGHAGNPFKCPFCGGRPITDWSTVAGIIWPGGVWTIDCANCETPLTRTIRPGGTDAERAWKIRQVEEAK